MNDAVIVVSGLQKRYGSTVAVADVSLEVARGEIFGLIGPNGAGKTTTMECVEGLRRADGGTVSVLGLDPRRDAAALGQRIGVQHQEAHLQKRIKVWEAIDLWGSLYSRVVDTEALLSQLGLETKRNAWFMTLSGGQKQRLFVALALIHDPEVVFLDEPMSGLDPLGRRQVRDLILGLRAKGTTVFFSSHILSDAETLCSRVAIMAQGRLAATGRISEMVAFQLKGWELVVSGVTDDLQAALAPKVAEIRPLSQGRFTLRIAPDQKPERLMAELSSAGASVESLHPVRDTLEDYFVQQVTAAKARDTGGL